MKRSSDSLAKLSDYITAERLRQIVSEALDEDIGSGDITTDGTLGPGDAHRKARAILCARSAGVLAGQELFCLAFESRAESTECQFALSDGSSFGVSDELATVSGPLAALLSGERVALNLLARLSGVATLTADFVNQVKDTPCQILDTRKTTPGWRALEKYAVRCGGGANHRFGLYDMVLIKENHISAVGSITQAVDNVRCDLKTAADRKAKLESLEVEVTGPAELSEALACGVTRVLIDNQAPAALSELVHLAREINPEAKLEASGNVTLENVADYAATGVDYISVGLLTHSAPAADMSLLIEND
ncbi:MAG: carboxylating nicotinate-nucleotide diphosphorylase [Candidatus Zixiibacteriota bacterium]